MILIRLKRNGDSAAASVVAGSRLPGNKKAEQRNKKFRGSVESAGDKIQRKD